ncbi:MAG: SDR family NAD(P)-dependent oxidoreductase [Flavobacteriaceae bacterium]
MKNVIITGTSSGLGFELVNKFIAENYSIISLSRSTCSIKSSLVEHCNFDITNPKSISDLKKLIQSKYKTIDILINNAGMLINKPFIELSKKEFISVYDVNFFGVIELIQGILPFFKSKSQIINISSIGGINGTNKFKGLSAYSSSKGALNILTEVLAEEFKETGPVINSLCLGSVQTKMLEQAFPGYKAQVQPREMANFIYDFSQSGGKVFNGKIIPISLLDT